MPNKKEQLIPFSDVIKDLYRLCRECRSGTLYIYTEDGHGAIFTLSRGNIVDIFYGASRGLDALEEVQKITLAKSIFKNDSGMRDKLPDDTTPLPANTVIFSKLGINNGFAASEMNSTVKKILLVEDSTMSRKVILKMFAGKDYEIIEAKDGMEAMEKMKLYEPDLVLLDLILPKMDGYEVLHNMKNDNTYKDIPVIVLTSRDTLFDKLKGKMSGTDEYLTKPVDQDKLMNKVKKYLE